MNPSLKNREFTEAGGKSLKYADLMNVEKSVVFLFVGETRVKL
jgi:hypothetical protein